MCSQLEDIHMPEDRAFGWVEKKLCQIEDILLSEQYLAMLANVAMSTVMGKIAKEAIELCIKGQLRSRFLKQRNWRLTQLHYQRFAFTTALLGQSILSLKGEKRWSSVQPARTTVETCVKPAKSDVKNLKLS